MKNDVPGGRGPGREGAPRHDEREDPGPGGRPGGRVERGDREQDDAGVADDRVADDVLDVVLDERGDRGQDDRTDGDPEDDSRTGSRSSNSGATDASAQASATIASAAGASAVTRGSDVSGTVSVSRAAQAWSGIAPNRTATASAKAR